LLYDLIFFTNVLRIMDEQGMTKQDLSEESGVSISFVSDITTGQGNPSLKIMEKIAAALQTPLPFLLENSDLPPEALDELAGRPCKSSLPAGYVRVSAVLSEFRAFVVRGWAEETKRLLKR
jgi:transcriptional regulator with XRE-family HTH domain